MSIVCLLVMLSQVYWSGMVFVLLLALYIGLLPVTCCTCTGIGLLFDSKSFEPLVTHYYRAALQGFSSFTFVFSG
ncbi:hypothetical protein Dsin_025376 [Dipteronia sinensis]|uniref:Uncharacterized protein n=1 Tax=Dipteronia sinensis TaxID=43782 RepID=A0AAD9ZVW5_9ROSI|nr:hypothetical protein Dsin_025376 [Dipteronia sinensis]